MTRDERRRRRIQARLDRVTVREQVAFWVACWRGGRLARWARRVARRG